MHQVVASCVLNLCVVAICLVFEGSEVFGCVGSWNPVFVIICEYHM